MPSRRRRIHRSRKSRKPILITGFLVAVAAITIVVYIISTGSSSKNKVLLSTSMGDIVIQLRDDMPITTGNFKKIVQLGLYNGTIFHRVIPDFMIQGGDITGTGLGSNAWPSIPDEFTNNNTNSRGTIAMANTGEPNSGSCQFFINLANNNERPNFDKSYPVFGWVLKGMDVVDSISRVATDENNRPLQEVKLIKVELIE
jgi:peptidylprolyl isomerase